MKNALFLFLILSLGSCSTFFQMEKRHYRSGFYIPHKNSASANCPVIVVKKDYVAKQKALEVDSSKEENTILDNSKGKSWKVSAVIAIKKKTSPIVNGIKSISQKPFPIAAKGNDEKTPGDRSTSIAKIFGILAIVLMIIGLMLVEVSPFGIVPIILGICFASLGLKFGRTAMQFGSKKRKGFTDTDEEVKKNRKKAKNAYLLNVAAILILSLYVLARVGIVLAEVGSMVGLALFLLAICLLLFLFFKIDLFTGLKD